MKLPTESSSSSRPSAEDVRPDVAELAKALGDLSFECDGVVGVQAPTSETYNRTFAIYQKYRALAAAAHPQPSGVAEQASQRGPGSDVAPGTLSGTGRPDVAGLLRACGEYIATPNNYTAKEWAAKYSVDLVGRCRSMIASLAGQVKLLQDKDLVFAASVQVQAELNDCQAKLAEAEHHLAEYRADAETLKAIAADLYHARQKLEAAERAVARAVDAARGASTKEVDRAGNG